ncbi:pilus assembly protein [Paenibacillus motobuensis]|uniref:Pilus assembly protein TadE n=1 Tax=Paenibacillus motobuensis TaxID=295324 RepID=A0ABP3HWE2_9BACL
MKRLIRDQKGSFILESSLVFPSIFVAILILLFFCLYLYQNAALGQVAAVAAERSAYSWDNSYRKPLTGAYETGKYDSLYWRLKDDGMLQAIFGWSSDLPTSELSLPFEQMEDIGDSLPLKKLATTGTEIPAAIHGRMQYENKLLLRKVRVGLDRLIPLVPLERVIGDVTQSGQAVSYVVEPVEWIRTVDLARYYGAKFKGGGGEKMDQKEAGKALTLFGKQGERP